MTLDKKTILAFALISTPALQLQAQEAKNWQFEVGENATQAREQWQQVTRGEELARGKAVQFFPPPNYRLTTDNNDPLDLTDGTLSSRADDRVWFNKDAVGWFNGVGTTGGVLMVIDLGVPQPVGQIAIRVLGGREQSTLELPGAIEFLASADGKQYHTLQSMVKLNPAERGQADFKTGFYIPEEGKPFMVPLVSREATRARYVAVRVRPLSGFFVDQISVLKATTPATLKNLESFPQAQVYTEGLVVSPRHNALVVSTNVATPNWLTVQDNSGLDPAKSGASFRMELPEGLRLLPQSGPTFKEVASKPGINAYQFSFGGTNRSRTIGPLWIEKSTSANIPAGATVKFVGMLEGKDSHIIESPLQIVAIPEVPPIKALDNSLTWLTDPQQQKWPNFLRDYRKMGFDFVPTFPRYFNKDKSGKWNQATQQSLDSLQQARREGYGIVYNESPFHVMWNQVVADRKAGRIGPAEAEQLFTQIDGKPGTWMNILYRGKYFQDEIKRVAELAALVQPDQVLLDIEWWEPSVAESKKDPRVIAAWKQSGKEWDEFVTDLGTEVLRTLVTTMRQAVPQKQMVVGLYHSDPTNKINDGVFHWNKIYPSLVDIAQPSLYIQGRSQIVADRIRSNYDAMKQREIVPWLTAGTYGEFAPSRMEPMVLETILNGARGVTYYQFSDFDALDFYYHAKALATLAQFDELLQTGEPIDYKGDNPNLHYTAFASNSEALVLVGNYGGSTESKVNLPLPLTSAKTALMDNKPLEINGNSISLTVPPGEFRLIALK